MSRISHIITDQNITVNYDGQTHIISRGDKLADQLIEALRNGEKDKIPSLISAKMRIEKFSDGNFTVQDGNIYVKGQLVPAALGKKIQKFALEKLPYEPLVKFAEKLLQNPSFRAVNELFLFLENNDHPITDDGNFIAYKRVRGDFRDIHSGTFDNSVGNTISMPRNQVNEDPNQTCSYGLHVANWDYAHNQFASADPVTDIMLEVEVNPANVVSVPRDYANAKMRVCEYVVLGVVDKEHSSETAIRYTSNNSVSAVEEDNDEFEEDYEEDYERQDMDVDDDSSSEEEEESSSSDEEDDDEYPYEDEI